MRTLPILAAIFALLTSGVIASEEGILPLRKFHFESANASGPVIVTGAQGDKGLESLEIRALQKTFTLTPAQLQQFHGLIVNGVQLSGEAGYAKLGGRTVYLLLSLGFTSGISKAKLVSVNERGDIKIEDWKRR